MTFRPAWLALREPYDAAARCEPLATRVGHWVATTPVHRIVDLGAGTGSTLRYLGPRLAPSVRWLLVDIDAENLARVVPPPEVMPEQIETRTFDLATALPPLDARDLVTASAFFDLVSASWIEGLAEHLATAGAALYATLTVDGRHQIHPEHPLDPWLWAAFRRHQTETDKGFGLPAGPRAGSVLGAALRARGFDVMQEPSDWVLGEAPILNAMITGLAGAAAEVSGDHDAAQRWLRSRQAQVEAGTLRLRVGHEDCLALP